MSLGAELFMWPTLSSRHHHMLPSVIKANVWSPSEGISRKRVMASLKIPLMLFAAFDVVDIDGDAGG